MIVRVVSGYTGVIGARVVVAARGVSSCQVARTLCVVGGIHVVAVVVSYNVVVVGVVSGLLLFISVL